MKVALWDSLGTLLDLEPVRAPFAARGVPQGLEAWFGRILHTGAALSLAGEFHTFAALAESTLPAVLAQLGLPSDERGPLEALQRELRPNADAAAALDLLDESGVPSWVVTNGGREATERALARGGLEGRVRGVVSIDEVEVWKPARAPYAEALRRANASAAEAWLIAVHAWDVHAARRHGLNAVWVDRVEREWTLPGEPPAQRVHDLPAAARIVADA